MLLLFWGNLIYLVEIPAPMLHRITVKLLNSLIKNNTWQSQYLNATGFTAIKLM